MAENEDVEMITSQMGDLQCQENDKKDVSLDIKGNMGFGVPHCVLLVLGICLIVSITRNPLTRTTPSCL